MPPSPLSDCPTPHTVRPPANRPSRSVTASLPSPLGSAPSCVAQPPRPLLPRPAPPKPLPMLRLLAYLARLMARRSQAAAGQSAQQRALTSLAVSLADGIYQLGGEPCRRHSPAWQRAWQTALTSLAVSPADSTHQLGSEPGRQHSPAWQRASCSARGGRLRPLAGWQARVGGCRHGPAPRAGEGWACGW